MIMVKTSQTSCTWYISLACIITPQPVELRHIIASLNPPECTIYSPYNILYMSKQQQSRVYSGKHLLSPFYHPFPISSTQIHGILPRKSHQRRIQYDRQKQMTRRHCTHRQYRNEIVDLPAIRHKAALCQGDHTDDSEQSKEDAELEPLDDFRDLDEEVAEFCFLAGGAPRHVDLEHVRQQGLRDMQR
jgi:hypothetical protein